jgi:hypothetical protein
MLSVTYAEWRYADCCYAECRGPSFLLFLIYNIFSYIDDIAAGFSAEESLEWSWGPFWQHFIFFVTFDWA